MADRVMIVRAADRMVERGPAGYFTGTATLVGRFQREAPARLSGVVVRFEPGARTAWHRHPLGQTLIVTEGHGWTQERGGPVRTLSPGDMLWCPPGVVHWHGATPDTAMTHVALQEAEDGETVEWFEEVSEADYRAGP